MASTSPAGLISQSTASLYRKELATGKITQYAGKGLPRAERDATDDELQHRRGKLTDYDAHKMRSNTGKWQSARPYLQQSCFEPQMLRGLQYCTHSA
jgi:Zn/Cd-binding protein ZinT